MRGKIVAEERGAISQVSRAQHGRRRRVRDSLVRSGELDDDGLGRHPIKRLFPEVRRIRNRAARLRNPLYVLEELLDLDGTTHGVGDHWLVPERHVLVELDAAGATDI